MEQPSAILRSAARTVSGNEVFRPVGKLDPRRIARTFVLRTSEGFVENFPPALLARLAAEAPGVCQRFTQKPDGWELRRFRLGRQGARLRLVGRRKQVFDRMNRMDRMGCAAHADGFESC